eukprot:UN29001
MGCDTLQDKITNDCAKKEASRMGITLGDGEPSCGSAISLAISTCKLQCEDENWLPQLNCYDVRDVSGEKAIMTITPFLDADIKKICHSYTVKTNALRYFGAFEGDTIQYDSRTVTKDTVKLKFRSKQNKHNPRHATIEIDAKEFANV